MIINRKKHYFYFVLIHVIFIYALIQANRQKIKLNNYNFFIENAKWPNINKIKIKLQNKLANKNL